MEELIKIIYQIDWRIFFQIASFIFNISGTVILAIPLLRTEEDIHDDEIIKDRHEHIDTEEKYFYTRRGFLKDKKLGLCGLGLLGFGFLIQLFLVIL